MKKVMISTLLLVCAITSCFSQNEKKKEYKINTVAFYNLENLFDTIDNSITKDEYSPILKMKGNKTKAYWNKINNMARVLSEIGKEKSGKSPAIIGISEIENDTVIKDLLNTVYLKNKNYDYIHIDSQDWRGIDVALLYKTTVFSPSDYKAYELKAWNDKGYRVKTRSQLLVSGYLDTELIHVIVNHWPSQRGGAKKTAYLRKKSAELNNTIISELREVDPNAKILTIGDFNDDPNSISIKKGLNSVGKKKDSKPEYLYNPFENMFKKGIGSLGFRDNINLFDQIIFSSNLLVNDDDYTSYKFYKAGIYNPKYLINSKGRYKGYPYRSWSSSDVFSGGYSDHFPVYIFLIKEK
jgi:hypothetical protein